MAKQEKNLLSGFSLNNRIKVDNGLKVPTGREESPKEVVKPPVSSFIKSEMKPTNEKKEAPAKVQEKIKPITLATEGFKPMINIVPTIDNVVVPTKQKLNIPKREKQRVTADDINLVDYGALPTKEEKITYLAKHGWSLKVERRGNNHYHYATKYVNRKKKRMYLNSINSEM